MKLRVLIAGVLAFTCAYAVAQEVEKVDLTGITPRLQLRRAGSSEPAFVAAPTLTTRTCGGGDPHHSALRTSVVSLDREDYAQGDAMTIEVTVENVGELPVTVPVSPHLSDLQPPDASAEFSFYELILPLMYSGKNGVANFANIILFGSPDHSGWTRELTQGQWITVRAVVHPLLTHADGMQVNPIYGERTPVSATWEYFKTTLHATTVGFASEQCQLALGRNPGTTVMVRWVKR